MDGMTKWFISPVHKELQPDDNLAVGKLPLHSLRAFTQ